MRKRERGGGSVKKGQRQRRRERGVCEKETETNGQINKQAEM